MPPPRMISSGENSSRVVRNALRKKRVAGLFGRMRSAYDRTKPIFFPANPCGNVTASYVEDEDGCKGKRRHIGPHVGNGLICSTRSHSWGTSARENKS